MDTSLQGSLPGVVVAVLGLYLLFGPIEQLARKPSPIKREFRGKTSNVPTWMKVFFRSLGVVLLVLAGLLLAPVFQGATDRSPETGGAERPLPPGE